jgi:hypothetical protein
MSEQLIRPLRDQLVRIESALCDTRPKQAVGEMVVHAIKLADAAMESAGFPDGGKSEAVAWNALTDEDRKAAFESLPDMLEGFLKKWGWLNFAKEIERRCMEKNAAPQAECAPREALTDAARDVLGERRRQVTAEGWTAEHDDQYLGRELAGSAACYCLGALGLNYEAFENFWPWDEKWWKPTNARRDLVKAAALILAEIERLDRAAITAKERP